MDLVTQGVIGAAAAQAVVGPRIRSRAWLVGAIGGLLPDADVFIRSAADPLLAIEYHRQFTHSFVFIPAAGLIAALPWIATRSGRAEWRGVLAAGIVGAATHGLLDACTTYGTQLFWPFASTRVAWDWISIVDPVFTLTLLIGTIIAARRARRRPAAIALAIALAYIGLGAIQHARALAFQQEMAARRGHGPSRGEAFPTLANNIVWRSLYQVGDSLYADRIRVPWFGAPTGVAGTSVRLMDEHDLSETERRNPRIIEDFRRFAWFSSQWVARAPGDTTVIGDVRYSLSTNGFDPIWGVRFHPGRAIPTEWVDRTRDRELGVGELWDEITGDEAQR
jgi:inner membrane protein